MRRTDEAGPHVHTPRCENRVVVCACVRVLGRVICDVSGPIGCHLSSRCRRVPPLAPVTTFFLSPSLSIPPSFPFPPFVALILPFSISLSFPPSLPPFLSPFRPVSLPYSFSFSLLRTLKDAMQPSLPSSFRTRLRIMYLLGLMYLLHGFPLAPLPLFRNISFHRRFPPCFSLCSPSSSSAFFLVIVLFILDILAQRRRQWAKRPTNVPLFPRLTFSSRIHCAFNMPTS